MSNTLRPLPHEDLQAWTRQVFAAGDLAGVAMFGESSCWQHAAAVAMLRGRAEDLARLQQHTGPAARLHLAAAVWIHGDIERARNLLQGLHDPHARRFAALLAKPRLKVLTQLPWLAGAPTDLLGGAAADPCFEIRNLGHRDGDITNTPYLDVRTALDGDFQPDFFLAAMVEWQQLPPNLQALPCPVFGHIADHDLHIQTLAPWLPLFDELCVTDRSEWLDVQGLGNGAVTSFPKVFGVPRDLPPVPSGERGIDAFVSGTLLDPYHPDKARLLHGLLGTPELELRLVDGFAGAMAFHAMLAHSRSSFTFVRRPGAMPTRGLESLAMGCAVALQEESVLNLYVGPAEGIVPYGPHSRSLGEALRLIRAEWQRYGPAALRGAARVREEFELGRVASQYLRYLTFRAAAPRPQRKLVDPSKLCQQRLCVSRTWLPGSPAVRRRNMQANFRQLGQQMARQPAASTLVAMARELLLEYQFYRQIGDLDPEDEALHANAIHLLERGRKLFPRHLVCQFILARMLLHAKEPAQRAQGYQLAHDILVADPTTWQVNGSDDVLPFDYHGEFFHYRAYLDLASEAAKGRLVAPNAYVELIRASLAGYLARKTGRLDWHELAATLDPGFARYRLDWARALLELGEPAAKQQALIMLRELAAGSGEFVAAGDLLAQHGTAADIAALRPVRWRLATERLDAKLQVRRLFDHERRAPAAARRQLEAPTTVADRIAILVPSPGSTRELLTLLAELNSQTVAGDCTVYIALRPSQASLADAAAKANATRMPLQWLNVAEHSPWANRLQALVDASTAPFLTVAMPGDRIRPDAFALLAEKLAEDTTHAVAVGADGWTAGAVPGFDPSACIAVACRPPFARERLQQTNAIGLHAMWRRELHAAYGGFDARYGTAAEHEFWLRLESHWTTCQLPLLLSSNELTANWRQERDPATDEARVRQLLAGDPRCGGQAFVAHRPLPAQLLAPGIDEEATSHARLGLLSQRERNELRMLENFHGTALMHQDRALAIALLDATIQSHPGLLSARLAKAELLQACGLPGAETTLIAARSCEPYGAMVANRLNTLRDRKQKSSPRAKPDSHCKEPEPCLP